MEQISNVLETSLLLSSSLMCWITQSFAVRSHDTDKADRLHRSPQPCSQEIFGKVVFWNIMSCGPVKGSRRFREAYCLHFQQCLLIACFMPVSCLAYSSTLIIGAMCSSDSWVGCHHTKQLIELFVTVTVRTSNPKWTVLRINRKHGVSESGSLSVLRWGEGEYPLCLGPLERANLNHWRTGQLEKVSSF
jgi:hypothetical protein